MWEVWNMAKNHDIKKETKKAPKEGKSKKDKKK